MIFDAIFGSFASLLASLLGALPTYTLPDFFTQTIAVWTQVLAVVGKLSFWLPLPTIGLMGTAVFSAVGVAIAVRLLRVVLAYIPGLNGSQQ